MSRIYSQAFKKKNASFKVLELTHQSVTMPLVVDIYLLTCFPPFFIVLRYFLVFFILFHSLVRDSSAD